ncbi:hypothetical protein QQ045_014854 [Rhodiola kirilowii]
MSSDRTTAKVTPVVPKDGQDRKLKPPPPDHHVKCPRCDSPNTKFCYYNNYSLSQPRHFCKTCRRYWTKGGALRNVPIGGGCRKNKKMKQGLAVTLDPRDSSSCEIMGSIGGGHNFFQGFLTPAMDFQLGSSSINPPSISSSMFPANVVDTNFSLYEPHHNTSHLRSTTHHPSSNSVATLMSCGRDELAGTLQMGTNNNNNSMIVHSNLASSIESLSSINQELHWKLQQERLAAVLFPGDQSEKRSDQADLAQVEHQTFDHHHHQPQGQTQKFLLQPILFQNLETTKEADHPYSTSESIMEGPEIPRKSNNGGGHNSATEWFLDANPYTNGRSNNNRGLNDDQGNNTMNQQAGDDIHHNNNWNTGIQAWNDMQQFSGALP